MILTDLHAAGLGNNVEDEALGFHLKMAKSTQDCFKVGVLFLCRTITVNIMYPRIT